MVNLSFDLNVHKESSDTDETTQYGGNPKSLTFEIHHGGCFTPRLADTVVNLGYGVADLMYYHFLRPILGLDYGLHPLNVDVDVLEMENSVEGQIVVETVGPFDGLDEILGDYVNTKEEITRKQMIFHVEVEVDAYNETKEESDTKENDISGSGLEDLDYDPKHDEVFDDDDEHILEDVHAQLLGLMYNKNQIHTLQQELLEGCPWTGQILITFWVNANNGIYPIAYVIVEAESKASWYYVNHIHENMKSQFKGSVYKDMLYNATRATTVVEFNKKIGKAKCDLLLNNVCKVFNRQLVDDKDQAIITCAEFIKDYLMKKGCRVQGGASQAGARQAACARNASSQAASSSQPSAAPSTTSQGLSQHSAGPTQVKSNHGFLGVDSESGILQVVTLLCERRSLRISVRDINRAASGDLMELSVKEAWETIEDCVQCDKQWRNPTSTLSNQLIANLKAQLVRNEIVRVKIPRNYKPTKYPQILPSFEEHTPPATYLKEVEDLGTWSSKEVPSFDEPKPQPQPLPNCPSLDVSLREERGSELPIKPYSSNSFRIKSKEAFGGKNMTWARFGKKRDENKTLALSVRRDDVRICCTAVRSEGRRRHLDL
nr:hypothetical protein [Tanacetum cinerariifolium]